MPTRSTIAAVPALPARPSRAPRRRLRGARRYFRGVARRAAAFTLHVADGAWWNMWHYHADWKGWGNLGWRRRLAHLRALAVVFRGVAAAQARVAVPVQSWLLLDADDAGQDAVFLHSPNPHDAVLPWRPAGEVDAGTDGLAGVMAQLLPGLRVRVLRLTWRDDDAARTVFVVWSPDVGVPLAE